MMHGTFVAYCARKSISKPLKLLMFRIYLHSAQPAESVLINTLCMCCVGASANVSIYAFGISSLFALMAVTSISQLTLCAFNF